MAALITQLLIERKKPPFPPSPFQQWRWRRQIIQDYEQSEVAPLLSSEDENIEGNEQNVVVGYILGHRAVTGIVQGSPVTTRNLDSPQVTLFPL